MAAAAVAVFLALPRAPGEEVQADVLTSRGGDDALGVRVRCLLEGAAGPSVVDTAAAGARTPVAALHCPRGGLLAFSTTNLSETDQHVFVVGLTSAGERRWLAPFTAGGRSAWAPAGAIDQPLDIVADTTQLPDDIAALHVLIGPRPFDGDSVERQLARSPQLPLGKLGRLPVDIPVQARIEWRR
jgi:hypothetical protein